MAAKRDDQSARRGEKDSAFESGTGPRRMTNADLAIPAVAPRPSTPAPSSSQPASSSGALNALGAKRLNLNIESKSKTTASASAPARPKAPAPEVERERQSDAFKSYGAERKRADMLGLTESGARPVMTLSSDSIPVFVPDGKTAPASLTSKDTWRAVMPLITSEPGKRSRQLYEKVILQFALATNPRYRPDVPERPRGHIFIWDISRAMGCEIQHFAAGQELSLGQTVDWLRRDGVPRGWKHVSAEEAIDCAEVGQLVLALPHEIRHRQLAIVHPQRPTMTPLVSGAGLTIGVARTAREILGVTSLEYFTHP